MEGSVKGEFSFSEELGKAAQASRSESTCMPFS
jgi:hypothetical protein